MSKKLDPSDFKKISTEAERIINAGKMSSSEMYVRLCKKYDYGVKQIRNMIYRAGLSTGNMRSPGTCKDLTVKQISKLIDSSKDMMEKNTDPSLVKVLLASKFDIPEREVSMLVIKAGYHISDDAIQRNSKKKTNKMSIPKTEFFRVQRGVYAEKAPVVQADIDEQNHLYNRAERKLQEQGRNAYVLQGQCFLDGVPTHWMKFIQAAKIELPA